MRGFAEKLAFCAKEKALAQGQNGDKLRDQIKEAYKSLAELAEQLKGSDMAAERLKMYRPKLGSDYSCPICWQERGAITRLLYVREDHAYRCKTCGFREIDDEQEQSPPP